MIMSELMREARELQIRELNLLSLEGGCYLLEILAVGGRHVLKDESGQVQKILSLEHARILLESLPAECPFYLVQFSAYDEMCGLADGVRPPLKLPVSLRSAWSTGPGVGL